MSIAGLAVMNPIATMAMVDTSRWRPVVYADTPKTLARYKAFLLEEKKADQRRIVNFVFGASYLPDVLKNKSKFDAILVFDDLQNLHTLTTQIPGFEIVDVDRKDGAAPKYLSPQELTAVLDKNVPLPEQDLLLKKVTAALGPRRPSVLETTSRLPSATTIQESGAQRRLCDIKDLLDDKISFPVLLDHYVKYVFRVVDRNQVTQAVTKKLPASVKDSWKEALDFADSEIGKKMAVAYRSLCLSSDPDYRIGHAVAQHGLKQYGGDFSYFTAVLPPHKNCAFLPGVFDESDKEDKPLVPILKPTTPEPKASKSRSKKAKGQPGK